MSFRGTPACRHPGLRQPRDKQHVHHGELHRYELRPGTAAIANSVGILVQNGAANTGVGVTISATGTFTSYLDPSTAWNGSQNLISGNSQYGVRITGSTTGRTAVAGNYIGTDQSGKVALGNALDGVRVEAPPNALIGITSGSNLTSLPGPGVFGNLISANGLYGIEVTGSTAVGASIAGNIIGLAADGVTRLGNASAGVEHQQWGHQHAGRSDRIRATTFAATSSPATQGPALSSPSVGTNNNSLSERNYIGTSADGTIAVGNTAGGVVVQSGATGTRIGTNSNGNNDAFERNVISGNTGDGILITGSGVTGTTVVGNYVGTSASGAAALGNQGNGILINGGAFSNTIGGTAAGAGNVISGNNQVGNFSLGGLVISGRYHFRQHGSRQPDWYDRRRLGGSPESRSCRHLGASSAPGTVIGGTTADRPKSHFRQLDSGTVHHWCERNDCPGELCWAECGWHGRGGQRFRRHPHSRGPPPAR